MAYHWHSESQSAGSARIQPARIQQEDDVPTYAYACTACEHRFEVQQAFSDATLTACPECEGRLRKLFNNVGIVFKGSGFYRTDSRAKNGASSSSASSPSSSSTSPSSSDGGSSSTSSSDKPSSSSSSDKPSSSSSGSKETSAA